MGLTSVDNALWLIGFVGQLLLLGVLIGKKRTKRFPWFTVYIAYEVIQNVALFVVYRIGSQASYFWTYWILNAADALLQLSVVYEMAREVLRPTGTWIRDARAMLVRWGLIGAAAAGILSFAVQPRGAIDLYTWPIRANIFSSLLICELIVAIFWASSELGLQWRDWVMGLARGLGLWVCVGLLVEVAHGYWGWTKNYVALDHVRIVTYDFVMLILAVSFWQTEPERRPVSPELLKVLETWHKSLRYDVTTDQSQ